MATNLRTLIQTVRSAKTATEERSIIQRECASIRHMLGGAGGGGGGGSSSSSSAPNVQQRARCVLKLAYISMLGYSTEFAQMHVVTLMAEPEFVPKRVAYLAIAILLDERQEVLTLCENHLKRDLDSMNPLVQCLALDAVANLAGEDMVHDVLQDIVSLVGGTRSGSSSQSGVGSKEKVIPAVRKKACLAALRIVRKVPSVADSLIEKLLTCVEERQHGVLITSLTALTECCNIFNNSKMNNNNNNNNNNAEDNNAKFFDVMRKKIPSLITMLKGLVLSAYATEYDVGSVADPFLQCAIIRFFAALAKDSQAASEAINDILAQVATNTDGQRNVGCAVLYECVRAISAIHSDDGLRVLGVNILGRFVLNKDNNIRYVALATLKNWVARESAAVQRHRMTIMECLKDSDLSLRRKALELTVALINEENVRSMVPDLLSYLQVCAPELKQDCCSMLCNVVERFSPNAEWRVEISLRLLTSDINYNANVVPIHFALNFIGLVTRLPQDLKTHAVSSLWSSMLAPFQQQNNNNNNNNNSSSSSSSSSATNVSNSSSSSSTLVSTSASLLSTSAILLQKEASLVVATWVVGEYSTLVLRKLSNTTIETLYQAMFNLFTESASALVTSHNNTNALAPSGDSSVSTNNTSSSSSVATGNLLLMVQQYVLTAVTKMASHHSSLRQSVKPLLELAAQSLDCELQQRACEYLFLLQGNAELASAAFQEMPAIPDPATMAPKSSSSRVSLAGVSSSSGSASSGGQKQQQKTGGTSFEELFAESTPAVTVRGGGGKDQTADIFGGGGGGGGSSSSSLNKQTPSTSMSSLFGEGSPQPQHQQAAPQTASTANGIRFTAFENNELSVILNVLKRSSSSFEVCDVETYIKPTSSSSSSSIRDIVVLVSVLKTMTVQMAPAVSSSVEGGGFSQQQSGGGGTLVQKFVVDATQDPNKGTVFQARVKLTYNVGNGTKSEVFTVNKDLRS